MVAGGGDMDGMTGMGGTAGMAGMAGAGGMTGMITGAIGIEMGEAGKGMTG